MDPSPVNLTQSKKAIKQDEGGAFVGECSLALGPPAKLPVHSLNGIGGSQALPLAFREVVGTQQLVTGFF